MRRSPRTVVAGNWKMHGSMHTLTDYVRGLQRQLPKTGDVQVVLFPPSVYLAALQAVLQQAGLTDRVVLGGQDLHAETQGAYTGDTAGVMLAEMGASYVLVGHSERRQYHSEDDVMVAQKAAAALAAELTPVICVGESAQQRDAGEAEAVVNRQIRAVTDHLDHADVSRCVVAYEPVWAIGTGRTATAEVAGSMHEQIRQLLQAQIGDAAAAMTLLYGGSVKAANAAELFGQPQINGGLVGGASLDAQEFAAIVDAGQQAAGDAA